MSYNNGALRLAIGVVIGALTSIIAVIFFLPILRTRVRQFLLDMFGINEGNEQYVIYSFQLPLLFFSKRWQSNIAACSVVLDIAWSLFYLSETLLG